MFMLSLICLTWGFISPSHIAQKARIRKPVTRKHTSIVFTPLVLFFIILVGATSPQRPNNLQKTSLKAQTPDAQSHSPTTIITKRVTATQRIPYTAQSQADSKLPKGQMQVAQTGENGIEAPAYKVTYTNGKQTSKTLISTVVTTKPITQITNVGTYISPASAPASSPTNPVSSSCYPLSNGGNCYEPGEYCRDLDHGASGLAGNGESITCIDRDGWRWEPE